MESLQTYPIETSIDHSIYVFYSTGPKGVIEKRLQICDALEKENIYTLAFGDWDEANDTLHDQLRSGNGDRSKIIATLIAAISHYTSKFPDRILYFEGITPAYTEIYSRLILRRFEMLAIEFQILGITNMLKYRKRFDLITDFDSGAEHQYNAFIIKRKVASIMTNTVEVSINPELQKLTQMILSPKKLEFADIALKRIDFPVLHSFFE